jgi:hypothetical protein
MAFCRFTGTHLERLTQLQADCTRLSDIHIRWTLTDSEVLDHILVVTCKVVVVSQLQPVLTSNIQPRFRASEPGKLKTLALRGPDVPEWKVLYSGEATPELRCVGWPSQNTRAARSLVGADSCLKGSWATEDVLRSLTFSYERGRANKIKARVPT